LIDATCISTRFQAMNMGLFLLLIAALLLQNLDNYYRRGVKSGFLRGTNFFVAPHDLFDTNNQNGQECTIPSIFAARGLAHALRNNGITGETC
jgi:hypothetical protein